MSTFKKRTIKRCEQMIKKENTIKKKKKKEIENVQTNMFSFPTSWPVSKADNTYNLKQLLVIFWAPLTR